jgi:hypothetical protein
MLTGFAAAVFAMTQGEFQPGTRRGLFSLLVVSGLLVLMFVTGRSWTHIHLPPGT